MSLQHWSPCIPQPPCISAFKKSVAGVFGHTNAFLIHFFYYSLLGWFIKFGWISTLALWLALFSFKKIFFIDFFGVTLVNKIIYMGLGHTILQYIIYILYCVFPTPSHLISSKTLLLRLELPWISAHFVGCRVWHLSHGISTLRTLQLLSDMELHKKILEQGERRNRDEQFLILSFPY